MQTSTHLEFSTLSDAIQECFKDSPHAFAFLADIFTISATWDDLIDRDTYVTDAAIHTMMELTLSLPLNPFYIQHFPTLHTLLHNAIRNWKAANLIERDSEATEDALLQAFVLRSSYIDLVAACAALVHDNATAERVSYAVRLLNSKEGFTRYKASLIKEQEARNGRRMR